ncbi:hypothetical protein ACGFNX_19895 [Streptomyces sp. NPDC048723]|uniref:hypothetical protein n=1 Tax=Streptomyces sp. NPDC048723 TaxID=3365589 RepID=UPI00371A5B97
MDSVPAAAAVGTAETRPAAARSVATRTGFVGYLSASAPAGSVISRFGAWLSR